MILDWTKDLNTPKEKEDFERSIQNSRPVLERLTELLIEREKNLDRSEMSSEGYDNPSWAYKQAHKNGFRAGLNICKRLIDLDKKIITLEKE